MSREILTIQLGNYANFVGTHWWNLQESNFSYDSNEPSEVNNDVLYREGETHTRQTTYTPRLLIADLKGSLGYLSENGNLYDNPQYDNGSELPWDPDKTEITTLGETPKSAFIKSLDDPSSSKEVNYFDFENLVKSWVDYIVPRFHPRTVNTVKQYKHGCTNNPFDVYNYGENLWQTKHFSEDFTDRIRMYVEECDKLQGFQVLVDSTDGFAGLGVACVQHLQDEYGKSIITFPCIDSENVEPSPSTMYKVINTAMCFQHIGEHSSLFSPLSCGEKGFLTAGNPRKFNHITYESDLKYHSSAILATALDTLTLRYRRKEYPNVVLSELCADLNMQNRKAAATSLTLPFPMTAKTDLIDVLDNFDGNLWTSLTPSCDIPMDKNMQSISLRGISEDRLKRPMAEAAKQIAMPAYRCSTVHEMMTLYLACTCHASATYLANISAPLKIQDPYPKVFNNNVTETGDIAGWPVEEGVKSVPVMAGLHSGGSLSGMYESLYNQASRVKNIKKYHVFTESGLEQDDYTECLNHLLDCKEAYEDHYV